MPISEAARADLYTGLAEVLGPDRAEILMAQLPRFDPAEVATKSDLADLRTATKSDMADLRAATKSDMVDLRTELRTEMVDLRTELRTEMVDLRTEFRDGLASVNQRLDRLFLTLLVAMFGIVAALISLVVTVG